MPVDATGFEDLKRMCESEDEDQRNAAWQRGWQRHPDNAPTTSAGTGGETGVIATSTQACIDRGQVVIDELLEADKLIDGETSFWSRDEEGTVTEGDNNQRIQRLRAVLAKYPSTYWTDHGCIG